MSNLREYLQHKKRAILTRQDLIAAGEVGPNRYSATTTAEGRSGVRRVRIREFQVITDSKDELAGYDLGPNAPELLLGALSACLTHYVLTHAALLDVVVDGVDVTTSATQDPRAGTPGHEATPTIPFDLSYVIRIESPEPDERVEELYERVRDTCALSRLLSQANVIHGELQRV